MANSAIKELYQVVNGGTIIGYSSAWSEQRHDGQHPWLSMSSSWAKTNVYLGSSETINAVVFYKNIYSGVPSASSYLGMVCNIGYTSVPVYFANTEIQQRRLDEIRQKKKNKPSNLYPLFPTRR